MEYRFNPNLKFIKDYQGNPFKKGQFFFGIQPESISRNKLIRWMLTPNPKRNEKRKDHWRPTVIEDSNYLNLPQDMIVWLGHASFLFKLMVSKFLPTLYFLTSLPFFADDMHYQIQLPNSKIFSILYSHTDTETIWISLL